MKKFLFYLCLFVSFVADDILAVRYSNYATCPNLLIKNGKIKRRQRGRFVKFICNPGFLLAGERYSTCAQGKWDPLPPKCVRPTCMNKVHPPNNGLIYPSHSGAALHFFCKSGFDLRGSTDVYCDGWKWDNNAPTCVPTNTKPKLYCDFEDDDICGWTHDLNHDFDWRRDQGNTPSGSIGTGPSFDHTKGPGQDGYYMYIESSSRNENDTARLISPIFDKKDFDTCLEFFYHMFGATTGTLRVFLKKLSESWDLKHSQLIFSKSGNQGDKWYRSYHSLGPIDEDYQIVIEGIRGPGYVSDIAIDDVKLIENCVYEDDTLSTTTEILNSTEILLTVESCENRCGLKAFGNETHQITCDCDDNCLDNSRCCPDYLDFCMTGSTTEDYYTTTDMANEIRPPETTVIIESSTMTTKKSTSVAALTTPRIAVTTASTPTTTIKKPTPKSTRRPAVNTTSTSTEKPTPKPTAKLPTKPALTTKKIIMPKRPTIQVLNPPTTPAIVRKVLPTKPTKIIYVKPFPPPKKESNDIGEVPIAKNNDKQELVTPSFSEEDVSKETFSEEGEDRLHLNLSESDKLFSQKLPEQGNYNIALVLISVVGVAVLTTVIAVFIIRRYRFSRRRLNCSNGDSQSDVRFLTSDEVLDFSLDRDDDDL